ncbi:MAG: histidine kinase [Caulobacter sp.]|nr:histidine kinase [Caulobacter sp.]
MPPDPCWADGNACHRIAAEEELQSFSYMVSHDLAASFRQVSEFSRLLLGELGEDLTTRQLAHAAHIRAATENCQLMMEQLLVYSRVQRKDLAKVRQDANSSLALPILQLAAQAAAAGGGMTIEPLGEVFADMPLLVLAFQHLASNAVMFHRPGVGPRIAVQPAHDEWAWRVRITDNGVGVEQAYREKVFHMFRRLHGADAFPGVGAGLAIARCIAHRHGGALIFLDRDEGACVELALPWDGGRPLSRATG